MELERQENIMIVCHQVRLTYGILYFQGPNHHTAHSRFGQAVLRCLYAYFHNLSQEDLPYIKIPLHTVIKLTPKAYGCDEERFKVPIKAVDTHRPKPKKEGLAPDSPALDPTIDHDPDGVLSKAPLTRTFFTEEGAAK